MEFERQSRNIKGVVAGLLFLVAITAIGGGLIWTIWKFVLEEAFTYITHFLLG